MRRTHLRGQANIYKRLCIHGGAFNLGLVMRKMTGMGTPRGLHGLLSALRAMLHLLNRASRRFRQSLGHLRTFAFQSVFKASGGPILPFLPSTLKKVGFSTGC